MPKVFLDTNVIVYANDARDLGQQERAIQAIGDALRSRNGVVSTQVLQEYAVVADTRLSQDADAILRQLRALEALEVALVAPLTCGARWRSVCGTRSGTGTRVFWPRPSGPTARSCCRRT